MAITDLYMLSGRRTVVPSGECRVSGKCEFI